MAKNIKIASFDPSLRNFGIAKAVYNGKVELKDLSLIKTKPNKKLNRGEDDLRCARKIIEEINPIIKWADYVVAEIPVGSQSARAAWTLGIVLGILATIPNLIEVSATEAKAVTGNKRASKKKVTKWATSRYPDANWLYYRGRLVNDNEHLADAVCALHAAINRGEFK